MEEETNESSLHFVSTQIQSRHEELESRENKIGKLSRFKNALEKVAPAPTRVVKKRTRKPTTAKKTSLSSLSAFVRETLGSKKRVDTQNVLDFFTGDEAKMNNFLDRLGEKTKQRTWESEKDRNRDTLVGEKEWKRLLEGIQLRFPAFSKKNRKSLRYITRQIEELQHREKTPADSADQPSIWSQASKQLSDNLTAEDVKWLYDLDDEHLDHTTFDTYTQSSQEEPLALTLSQVFEQVLQQEEDDVSVISNSESEPEDDFPGPEGDFLGPEGEFLGPEDAISGSGIPSHQHTSISDSVDVLTSIHFASTVPKDTSERMMRSGTNETASLSKSGLALRSQSLSNLQSLSKTQVSKPDSPSKEPTSPFKEPTSPFKEPKSPKRRTMTPKSSPKKESWPSNLVITSSPIQDSKNNSQEVFLTAPTNSHESQSEEKNISRSTIIFHGAIRLSPLYSEITMKTQKAQPQPDVVPDSEDEGELTLIEITKPVSAATESVLQVPSSPGLDLPLVLHPGDEVSDHL